MSQPKVMVAPLDWGLGHATRCIPVIQELLRRDCLVTLASDGSALALLKHEFPDIPAIRLPSYQAHYSGTLPLMISVLLQLPKFLWAIRKEHVEIARLISAHKPDLIISDNRYGCWSTQIPCIFITHQLAIQMPAGLRWMQPIVNFFNRKFIERFSECWIPDDPAINLSGILSAQKKIPVRYVGVLSRFKPAAIPVKYDLTIVLSGPEPQRTILEEIILKQIQNGMSRIVIVRGMVESETVWNQVGNISLVNFLPARALEEILNRSELVLARSGYSTIMDLACLGKKAVFIPTPGQTEQEYLAQQLREKKMCYSTPQHKFNLEDAIALSKEYTGFSNIGANNTLLEKVIDDCLRA